MTTYTFFLRGFIPQSRESGLSLSQAWSRVLEHSQSNANWDRQAQPELIITRFNGEKIELTSTKPISTDAEREVILLAMDGRLSGFTAIPDDEFELMIETPK